MASSSGKSYRAGRCRRAGTAALALLAFLFAQSGLPAAAQTASAAAKKPERAKCDRATFRAVIDVGHTAQEPGATSARGVTEYEFNLRLAKRIEAKLMEAGFAKTALLMRAGANRAGLFERVAWANALPADLFVSIHHDSVPEFLVEKWEYEGAEGRHSDRFKGHAIFISGENGQYARSLAFGRVLGRALTAQGLKFTPHYTEKLMGNRRRVLVDAETGVYRFDQLVVLMQTRMPAVLLEAGSIINRDEELVMSSPERQALIATAVTEAIDGYCASRRRGSG